MAGLGLECNITSVAEYHVTSDQLLSKKQADSRSFQPRYHDIIEDISDIKNWFHSDSRSPKKAETSSQRKDEPPISKGLGCLGLENVIAGTEKTHDLRQKNALVVLTPSGKFTLLRGGAGGLLEQIL